MLEAINCKSSVSLFWYMFEQGLLCASDALALHLSSICVSGTVVSDLDRVKFRFHFPKGILGDLETEDTGTGLTAEDLLRI